MPAKKSNSVQYHGVGRRKTSVARVFLRPGTGNIEVNGKTLEEYLPLETLRMVVKSPLELTNTLDQFDVMINVYGGGYTGQAGAMRHGITRALMECNEDYRPVLKAAGFVTRDPRAKERKKYGLKGARRLHSSQNVSINCCEKIREVFRLCEKFEYFFFYIFY